MVVDCLAGRGAGRIHAKVAGEARFAVAAVGALGAWRERRCAFNRRERGDRRGMNLLPLPMGLMRRGHDDSPTAQVDDGILDVVTASGSTARKSFASCRVFTAADM